MEVVGYQLLVVATIVVAYRLNPKYGLWAAFIWSVETLALVFFPPLILVQLGVVWATYAVVRSLASKDAQLRALQDHLREHPDVTRQRIAQISSEALQFISGREHQQRLVSAMEKATSCICILSGWVSSGVVDDQFLLRTEACLRRGVDVYLGYGYQDGQGAHSESRSSKKAVERLIGLGRSCASASTPGTLTLARFGNHEKILTIDGAVAICGSHNWLSNSSYVNRERSVVVSLPSFASTEQERVQSVVREHSINRMNGAK
jgi:phosphatidylserine/phosphatidylglycerophosphate/cardiolipin synthase-like enzyme